MQGNAALQQEPIAVLGLGCRLPGGVESPDDLWQLLVDGRDAIQEIPATRWDLGKHFDPDPRRPLRQYVSRAGLVDGLDQFDPAFFGISRREAQCMDPQQRLLLEVCWRAFEEGGHSIERLKGRSVGVFMGISSSDYSSLLWASESNYLTPDNEPFVLTGNTGCIAANRISYVFDLKGPSLTVDTACSSSLVAVHLACESLRRGETQLALAGGVQALIHPGIQSSFCKAGLLSPEGHCRSFDADADGYVRSEGAGAVLLKPLRAALEDGDPIAAVIRGTAVNSDGRSQGMAAPSQKAQSACVRAAYDAAGLNPAQTGYVEAHGTGTRQGDPTELRALGEVLGQGRPEGQPCLVGSVKSNLGHGETAAGITGLIKTVLCLRERQIPASLHYRRPHPGLDLPGLGLEVSTSLQAFPASGESSVASVSSFGFGGTNAHAVLSAAPVQPPSDEITGDTAASDTSGTSHLLWLSARSSDALELLRQRSADWLEARPHIALIDFCASINQGRSAFPEAVALIAADRAELLRQLRGHAPVVWAGTVPKQSSTSLPLQLARPEQMVQALAVGVTVDWAHWYAGQQWSWCQPPGHPFLRGSFWWTPQAKATQGTKGSLWLNHLGLARFNEPAAAAQGLQRLDLPGSAQHWQAQLNPQASADLVDHALLKQPVFAAAGYLALLLDWRQQCQQPLSLGRVELDRPLWFTDGPVQLQAVLDGEGLTFHSRSTDQDGGPWQLHGRVSLPTDQPDQPSPLESVREPLGVDEDGGSASVEALYQVLPRLGLDYGPCYRPIQQLWADGEQAEALLCRPDGAPDRCLLDGCFQLVAAVLSQRDDAAQLLLPVGLEALWMQRWPLPDQLRCRLLMRPVDAAAEADGKGHLLADLTLLDLDDLVLGTVEGLQLRRISRSLLELMVPEVPEHSQVKLLEDGWIPLTSASLTAWSLNPEESISVISMDGVPEPVQAWCHQQAIAPIAFDADADPAQLLADLVPHLQGLSLQAPRQLLLLLPCRSTAAVRALQAAVRSLAQDAPAWRCSTLILAAEELTEAVWQRLLAATSSDAEVRWCGGEAIETRQFKSIDADRFQILSDGTGRLDGLVQAPLPLTRLQPGELELAVEATGLNFRDVLNALGLLTSHNQSLGLRADARLPFGGEAVGRVVAVGPGVDPALVGQRMLAALTLGSLASHVRCRASLCVPWPEPLDPVLGASLSTAYLTAEHGLEQLAQLKAGEFVLIHAAAGGVGQAAVQVAKRCGARILATASAAKQAALLEQGVEAVFDSRSTLFGSQVLEHTAGRGADVVLNSLKGEWVDASFQALSQGGRFVELGKLEIWSDQQVQERRPDAIFHRFDLLEVAARDPQPLRQRLLRLVEAAQRQRLATLPTTAFPVERCKEAFRQMAQGRHVGKLVITLPQQAPPCRIRSDATYLLIGAFGSLGLRLQRWLVDQGAQSLLLLGRQLPQPGTEAAQHLNTLLEQGIQAQALTWEMLPQALRTLPEDLPLRGVIHAAGTLRDQRTDAIDPQSLQLVLDSKWGVAERLAVLQKQEPQPWEELDFEVIFSSIAAGLGSPGQLVYGAANGAVEGASLNGSAVAPVHLAIQWGPWAGSGMAAGLERRFEAVGLKPLQDEEALNALERLLQRGRGGVVTVMVADWSRLARQAMPRQASWFQGLLPEASGRTEEQMRAQLQALPEAQRRFWLITTLRDLLAGVMEEPADQLDPTTSLFDLGLDSLMAAEFAAVVQETLGWRLDLAALSDAPCLDDLAALALERLLPQGKVSDHRNLDLQLESQLPEGWALPALAAQTAPGETVLLTGASGFLGAYLLAGQLKRWPALRLRCLVRAASIEQGQERLEQNLRRYGLWQPGWASRLEVVLGDLAQPQLGLDREQFKAVGHGLGGILHNGAQLSQMASYGQLAAANVGGTRTMLQLATAESPLRFELISSVAVFEADALRDQPIDEQTPLEAWQGIQLGYSQTKWVTDRMVRRAAEAGLPVTVYRPPLIAGSSCGSTWHEGDLLQRLLMGALAVGASPDLAWELDVVPVDYVADAVTALAWEEDSHGKTFHLQHPEPMMLTSLLSQIASAAGEWRVLPMQDWLAQLEQDPGNPLQPMLPFFQQGWGSDGLTYPERNCVGQRARPSCMQTTEALLKHGVRCPSWDQLIGPWSSVLLSLASKTS